MFIKHVVSVCQFALEFGLQYTRDFKITISMLNLEDALKNFVLGCCIKEIMGEKQNITTEIVECDIPEKRDR